jgi:hypothetical protein
MDALVGSAPTTQGCVAAPATHKGLSQMLLVVQHKPATRGGATLLVVVTPGHRDLGTVGSTEEGTTVKSLPMSGQEKVGETPATQATQATRTARWAWTAGEKPA